MPLYDSVTLLQVDFGACNYFVLPTANLALDEQRALNLLPLLSLSSDHAALGANPPAENRLKCFCRNA